ncbi:MAG: hypothetical protein Q8Q89_04745 [bacterium]|nr:hypothetical protein [bacterium]
MLKNSHLILIVTFFTLPTLVLAQSGGTVPTETPVSTTVAPAAGAVLAPRVTPTLTLTPTASPLPTPLPSAPSGGGGPTLLPSPIFSPSVSISPIPTPADTSEAAGNSVVGIIAFIGSVLAVAGLAVYKAKTNKKNSDNDRCGNIKELLEQKKKELEEMIKNWPDEKLKSMAQDKVLGGLKKDEDVKKVIDTAENLKQKHDKLKEAIEMLQKKYDLCMLSLPSVGSGIRLSYLMGADMIQDKELEDLGIKIEDKTPDGDRMIKISDKELAKYIELIKLKLANGFWNEIIGGKDIIFIFKFKDGSVKEYKLSADNEQEIDKLCAEFNNEPPVLTPNVYKYISDNKFYHDFMMKHYSDMVNR